MSHTDSSFLRNMVIIIAALVVFMILIIIAANWLSSSSTNIQDDPMVQGHLDRAGSDRTTYCTNRPG